MTYFGCRILKKQTRYFDDFTAVMSLVDETVQKIPALFEFADSLMEKEKRDNSILDKKHT